MWWNSERINIRLLSECLFLVVNFNFFFPLGHSSLHLFLSSQWKTRTRTICKKKKTTNKTTTNENLCVYVSIFRRLNVERGEKTVVFPLKFSIYLWGCSGCTNTDEPSYTHTTHNSSFFYVWNVLTVENWTLFICSNHFQFISG